MTAGGRAAAAALALSAALGLVAPPCEAGITRYCDGPATLNAAQQDRIFRFGAVIKAELEAAGGSAALISRSGLDLSRFGVRYSHAGVSLRHGPETPWSVRQLYYACDEDRPRIFDQGLSAFLLGMDSPDTGYVSVLLLPSLAERDLERAALDNRVALALLGGTYSANAYPYSVRYQNCNQWVVELLATAWGGLAERAADEALRSQAQFWLQGQGYEPMVFDVGWRVLMWMGNLIPWIHSDDHPDEDTAQQRYRVSMPASLEGFVQRLVPGTRRIEFCHDGRQVVVRRGWDTIEEGCKPGPDDRVVALD